MFSIDLPFDMVYIVIDLFLLEGYQALIRVCLAMLKNVESKDNYLFIQFSLTI